MGGPEEERRGPDWIKCGEDTANRFCMVCGATFRRGEQYRKAGFSLKNNRYNWVHRNCVEE